MSRFQLELTVQPADLDELNHVNNLVYLRWTLKAAVAHSAALGWPAERYHRQGAGFVVRGHHIKYRESARLGDALVVDTWIASVMKASSQRDYRILSKDSGRLLAEASTTWAYVDFSTLRLLPIPAELKRDLCGALLDDSAPQRRSPRSP